MGNDKLTIEELRALVNAKNAREWDDACDQVKRARGDYPKSWFITILASDIIGIVSRSWGK